jgi:gamma-glutamyltranspeptidase/glutathione hydrolase
MSPRPGLTATSSAAMVATADDLATKAGVAALRAGGSAVDAAVAAGAVLAVTSPHACGLGGDLFALVYEPGVAPIALNAAGRSGSGADPNVLRAQGHHKMPFTGDAQAITVPGCVDGWLKLHSRYGRLALAQVLQTAIALANDGFAVSPPLADDLARVNAALLPAELAVAAGKPGTMVRRKGVGQALRAVAEGGRDAFYLGSFGAGLIRLGPELFCWADLQAPQAHWTAALSLPVWSHELWTTQPSSQGYLTLLGAGILERLDPPADPADPSWAHLVVESLLAAGHDRPLRLHDDFDARRFLPAEVNLRAVAIDSERASAAGFSAMPGGTTQICVVDEDRMGVSLMQSNCSSLGSLLFEESTGIELQNRGIGFSLEEGSVAEYGPCRRPPHTCAPALVTGRDGGLRAVLGAAGGDAQPQIVVQLLARLLASASSPGAALHAPRLRLERAQGNGFDTWDGPGLPGVVIEQEGAPGWVQGLIARGHRVSVRSRAEALAGWGHIIEVSGENLRGGAEPREPTALVAGL